jgi:hypothetical protein
VSASEAEGRQFESGRARQSPQLKASLPILLPALERNGHLKLDEAIRAKILVTAARALKALQCSSIHQ